VALPSSGEPVVSVEIGLCEEESPTRPRRLAHRSGNRPSSRHMDVRRARSDPRPLASCRSKSRAHQRHPRRERRAPLRGRPQSRRVCQAATGRDVFTLPRGPLPADPQDLLPLLAAGGARTVLLAGDERLADPFLARGLIDDMVAYIALVDDTPTSSLPDPAASLGLAGRISHVDLTRTRGGVRIKASAATKLTLDRPARRPPPSYRP